MTKEQKAANNRAWYQANRSKRLEQSRLYARAHREDRNRQARARHAKNPAKVAEYHKRYAAKHPDVIAAVQARFYEAHPNYQSEWHAERREERNAKAKVWNKLNADLLAAHSAERRALKSAAKSLGVNQEEITAFYTEARRRTLETGILHEVDHIWPLKGKGFVGLHVPWNLRVISKEENRQKRNRRPQEDAALIKGGGA